LHDDIELLRAAVDGIHKLRDASRRATSAEPAWDVVYARLEVASDAVVRASSRLGGRPAAAQVTRSKLNPTREGGPLVQ